MPGTHAAPPRARLSRFQAESAIQPPAAIVAFTGAPLLTPSPRLQSSSVRFKCAVSFAASLSYSPAYSPFPPGTAVAETRPRRPVSPPPLPSLHGSPWRGLARCLHALRPGLPVLAVQLPRPTTGRPSRRRGRHATRRPWPWPGCPLFLPQNRNFWFWNPEVPVSS